MKRRQFVKEAALVSAVVAAAPRDALAAEEEISSRRIPRWRGFNIQPRFGRPGRPYDGPAFEEADFEMMAEWGFDFARLPLWYWTWSSRDDWTQIREEPLKKLDQAIALGRQYGIHININFHRPVRGLQRPQARPEDARAAQELVAGGSTGGLERITRVSARALGPSAP